VALAEVARLRIIRLRQCSKLLRMLGYISEQQVRGALRQKPVEIKRTPTPGQWAISEFLGKKRSFWAKRGY
jgi:hypothetical protein